MTAPPVDGLFMIFSQIGGRGCHGGSERAVIPLGRMNHARQVGSVIGDRLGSQAGNPGQEIVVAGDVAGLSGLDDIDFASVGDDGLGELVGGVGNERPGRWRVREAVE